MKQDIAWMYCTEHGSVTGVESVNGEVTKINWAGAGLQGEGTTQQGTNDDNKERTTTTRSETTRRL